MRAIKAILLALLLAGCAAAPVAEPEQETIPEPMPIAEETIHYTVETEVWENTFRTEDDVELAAYRIALPVLSARRADGSIVAEAQTELEEQALTVLDTFNQKFAEHIAPENLEWISEWAEEDLLWRSEAGIEWQPYALELDCTVYQTEQLLSIFGLYYCYTGGAHPNAWQLSWNFDLEEGTFFSPEALSDDGLQETVSAEIVRQAQLPMEDGYIPAEMYWEDYENIVARWSSYAVTFDDKGMQVVFSPYELAPYAAGSQEFHISYDVLRPHLNEDGLALLGLTTE